MAKILFIEDEPALQETLGDFLGGRGHTVLSALDGEAGLEMVRRERPDLVLLDLILPRLHGIELLERMRKDPATAQTPVIILTNLESAEEVRRAIELGAKAYLVKTNYTLDEVAEKVEAVLGQRG